MTALRKILVVDDDPVVGKSFNRVLDGKGYVVVTAHDGPEALNRLAEGEYDLVVTDIRMPGMDGIEVTERVKAKRPWIPVVIVTGYGTADNENRARAAGVAGFLRKPLAPTDIENSARLALAPAAETAPAAPAIAAEEALEPAEMPPLAAPRRGIARGLETAAMMVVGPLVALAFIVAAPFVGLALLAWIGVAAFARSPLGRVTKNLAMFVMAPLVGLVYAIAAPFVGLTALAAMGLRAARERDVVRRATRSGLRHAQNVALFFAAPFIGLAYAVAFPFIGAWLLVRSMRKNRAADRA